MDNIVGLWLDIAGWGGAVAILASYLSVSMGWLRAGRRFQAANLVGSVAFIINGSYYGAWPSVVTNVAWFVISAVALVRMQRAASRAAQAPEAPATAPVETAAQMAPAHPVPVVTASIPVVQAPVQAAPAHPVPVVTASVPLVPACEC
ncbi:CBU_0592 family membrane protein [Arthrobacter celericrescens]|uniref:CBU_0592 family membrane protein n=1 Tax=Arthrobacter celericrescens TaxID=2320851 RepID=UPI000EA28808